MNKKTKQKLVPFNVGGSVIWLTPSDAKRAASIPKISEKVFAATNVMCEVPDPDDEDQIIRMILSSRED